MGCAARLDVWTARAPGPQLTPCGPGRVRQALDVGQALDVRRGSTCGPHALPDLSSPRADLDAFARRSTWARRSTCGAARRADLDGAPGPQLPCGLGRVRQALARRSTCGAARRADFTRSRTFSSPRADLDALATVEV